MSAGKSRTHHAGTVVALGAAGASLAFSAPASADPGLEKLIGIHLSPGAVWSWARGPVVAKGVGFEITAGYSWFWPWLLHGSPNRWAYAPHVAAYFRTVGLEDDAERKHRVYAAGIQGGIGPIGIETGYASRGAVDPLVPRQGGMQIAPFVSIGLLYFGPQFFFPSTGPARDPEMTVNLGLKFPPQVLMLPFALIFSGWSWGKGSKSGRPLRVDGDNELVATLVAGSRWRRDVRVRAHFAGDDETRSRRADHWLAEARAEHASIAAFARLAIDLLALGAPSALVAACHRAAMDEVRHAEHGFALAARFGERELDPGALPIARSDPPDLVRMALESVMDGGVGEGIAAEVARAGVACEADEGIRAVLRIIARDEARHAEIAWDIVAFCLQRGGGEVAGALVLCLVQLAESVHDQDGLAPDSGGADAACRAEPADAIDAARIAARVRAAVARRLESLVARRLAG